MSLTWSVIKTYSTHKPVSHWAGRTTASVPNQPLPRYHCVHPWNTHTHTRSATRGRSRTPRNICPVLCALSEIICCSDSIIIIHHLHHPLTEEKLRFKDTLIYTCIRAYKPLLVCESANYFIRTASFTHYCTCNSAFFYQMTVGDSSRLLMGDKKHIYICFPGPALRSSSLDWVEHFLRSLSTANSTDQRRWSVWL